MLASSEACPPYGVTHHSPAARSPSPGPALTSATPRRRQRHPCWQTRSTTSSASTPTKTATPLPWSARLVRSSRTRASPPTPPATAAATGSQSSRRQDVGSGRSRAPAATAPASPPTCSSRANGSSRSTVLPARRAATAKTDDLDAVRATARAGDRPTAGPVRWPAQPPHPADRASRHHHRAAPRSPARARPPSRGRQSPSRARHARRSARRAAAGRAGRRGDLCRRPIAHRLVARWPAALTAMLAGAAPIEESSGKVVRHRLNQSGDRQLNRALHTIALSRTTYHAETRAYVARRTAEGKTPREIKRCLKRYLARRLFKLLEGSPDHDQKEKIAAT